MKNGIVLVLSALLAAVSVAVRAETQDFKDLMDDSRKTAQQLTNQIRGELLQEMDRTGPMRAIIVCKYSAPEATSQISRRTGMRVTRVALNPRNRSIGEPDAWEQRALLEFEKRMAKGEKADNLEFGEYVTEPSGRFFRYIRAIPTGQPCLACHGSNLSEGVKAQLAAEYPHDKATNHALGSLRGGLSLKRPL